jgi:hypothetical protein
VLLKLARWIIGPVHVPLKHEHSSPQKIQPRPFRWVPIRLDGIKDGIDDLMDVISIGQPHVAGQVSANSNSSGRLTPSTGHETRSTFNVTT